MTEKRVWAVLLIDPTKKQFQEEVHLLSAPTEGVLIEDLHMWARQPAEREYHVLKEVTNERWDW